MLTSIHVIHIPLVFSLFYINGFLFVIFPDKLNERIRQLTNQNGDLEKKLHWTQERLKDLAKEKNVVWVDSMLKLWKYAWPCLLTEFQHRLSEIFEHGSVFKYFLF